MMKRLNVFRNGVVLLLPKYAVSNEKPRKSTFIDKNSIPRINKNLGNFNYDDLEKEKLKQLKKNYPN